MQNKEKAQTCFALELNKKKEREQPEKRTSGNKKKMKK